MLPGLISLCTIGGLLSWRYERADKHCCSIEIVSFAVINSWSSNDPPGAYAKNNCGWGSKVAWRSRTMWGCFVVRKESLGVGTYKHAISGP